jgi:hypothetical protein
VESAARTRLIIKKQLREEIEQEMAKELGLPANWRGNKLKSLADWHEKMACLAKADAAPRCEHVFQDGTRCGSPRMKTGEFCYAHERMARVRPKKLNLLAMEDANAIMLNIMEINRALVDEEITEKRAGMLLYSQQLGLQALGKLTFHKAERDRMILEEFEALGRESTRMDTNEEEIAADLRRKAQIGEEEFSREATRTSTNEEEELATDEHGRALMEEEVCELGEGGMDELSPVDGGMEGTGEEDRTIGSSGHRAIGKAEEFTAKDAKVANKEEQNRTAEVAESAEQEEQDSTTKDTKDHGGKPRLENLTAEAPIPRYPTV